MKTVSTESAYSNLDQLINQVNEDSRPAIITGQRNSAILLGIDDWNAIQETLYLQSIPGMTNSVHQAHNDGITEASHKLPW